MKEKEELERINQFLQPKIAERLNNSNLNKGIEAGTKSTLRKGLKRGLTFFQQLSLSDWKMDGANVSASIIGGGLNPFAGPMNYISILKSILGNELSSKIQTNGNTISIPFKDLRQTIIDLKKRDQNEMQKSAANAASKTEIKPSLNPAQRNKENRGESQNQIAKGYLNVSAATNPNDRGYLNRTLVESSIPNRTVAPHPPAKNPNPDYIGNLSQIFGNEQAGQYANATNIQQNDLNQIPGQTVYANASNVQQKPVESSPTSQYATFVRSDQTVASSPPQNVSPIPVSNQGNSTTILPASTSQPAVTFRSMNQQAGASLKANVIPKEKGEAAKIVASCHAAIETFRQQQPRINIAAAVYTQIENYFRNKNNNEVGAIVNLQKGIEGIELPKTTNEPNKKRIQDLKNALEIIKQHPDYRASDKITLKK